MVLLPLLSENHWRLVVFTRARTLRLYNPRGHPGHSPSEPYEVRSLLRTYAEVARLIFADCDPSRSAKIKARTQLQDEVKFRWDYAGVQRDRWSCGFWVFAFLFLLSLTIPKAIHGQNNDAASGRVFTHNSGAALGRVLRAEAETLINPIRLLTNAEDRVKVLKQVYLGLHREKT